MVQWEHHKMVNQIYIYIYGISCSVFLPPTPPMAWVPRLHPLPSICKLLAAFLRSTLVFARSLLHFWLPASHLLGTCYLLDDLHSTHTPSKYLCATCSHIYMCYVSTSSIYIYKHMYIYIFKHIYIYLNINKYIYIYAQYHTPTTPQGGRGTLLWLTHDHGREGGEGGRGVGTLDHI